MGWHRSVCRSVAGIALLSLSSALAAQTPQPTPPRETPVFGAAVTLVTVPVFVTDKSGRAVGGLTADDFEIEDGGRIVPIAGFQEIDVETEVSPETQAALADLPIAVQAAASRQFVLLIDSRFSPRRGLYFGNRAAADYIRDSLAPGDLVAVASTGPAGLKVIANFTRDHSYVASVLSGTATPAMPSRDPLGFSSGGVSGLASALGDPLGMGAGISAAGGAGNDADAEFAEQDALLAEADQRGTENGILGFLGDLRELVRSLAPLRGRKQIVLFSGGFSEGVIGLRDDIRQRMEEIYRDARRDDVVIHSVDLHGITEAIDLTSQLGPNGNLDSGGVGAIPHSGTKNSDGRGTLIAMSVNTGGRAIAPTGNFRTAFGEVDRISRRSYVIAFEPSEAAPDPARPRSLKVRVKRAGLSVSHRPEYTLAAAPGPSSPESVQSQAREAIAKGLSGGPLRLRVVTLPYRTASGEPSVNAVLQISGDALAGAVDGNKMPIQVFGYAMSQGRVLDGIAFSTSIDLEKLGGAAPSSGINVVTAFPVSTGNVDLRFFVSAGSSGVTGSIQRTVGVPAFTPDERVVSAPLFPAGNHGQIVFPFQPKGRPLITIPFYLGDRMFLPDASVTLSAGQPREACVFVWGGPAQATPFEVTAELIRSGQPPIPVDLASAPRAVREADGFDRYLVTLVPPPGVAGEYTLRLRLLDPATGRTSRTDASVLIEP